MSLLREGFISMYSLYPENIALIYHKSRNNKLIFTYSELYREMLEISDWLKMYISRSECIGVFLNDHPLLVPVLIGIHSLNSSFFCLNDEVMQSEKNFKTLGCTAYFISSNTDIPSFAHVKSRLKSLVLWTLSERPAIMQIINDHRIAYVIKTSGSTGEAKIVIVPHGCILPNIMELKEKFRISSEDKIFLGTPTTFDPFIIELYLTFITGACAIAVSKTIKYTVDMMKILFEITPITFLQTTPSVFRSCFASHIKTHILSKDSQLRLLVLGGEVCPSKIEMNSWKHKENQTLVFYLYGITEVSCWAMIREVNCKEDEDEDNDVYLGNALASTIIEIRDEVGNCSNKGEIYIGSYNRKCILNNENIDNILSKEKILFRASGDFAYKHDNKIYYYSRIDETIKRFGVKINLKKIEKIINSFQEIEMCCCLWVTDKLLVFYKSFTDILQDYVWVLIKRHLNPNEYPDYIHAIDSFPLSVNGKISKIKLKELYECQRNKVCSQYITEQLFTQELKNVLNYVAFDLSFLQLGGTSISALAITTKLECFLDLNLRYLMTMLLNENVPLKTCIQYINSATQLKNKNIDHFNNPIIAPSSIIIKHGIKERVLWKCDLDKCIDATPTLLQNKYIVVGSHSHKLATLNLHTGETLSTIVLPNRIESEVTYMYEDFALVGCYDGVLYCFNFYEGVIIWTFKTGDMIKSKALYLSEMGIVLIASYDHNIYAVEDKNGELKWSINICEKPLLSAPCLAPISNKILVCSLGGSCVCIDILTSSINWSRKFKYPIFSNSVLLFEDKNVSRYLFAEVTGNLHCIDEDGIKIWDFAASGSIYSSFRRHQINLDNYLVIFGCHDKYVYCIEVIKDIPQLKWTAKMESQIYSTPNFITLEDQKYVICASTNGQISIINLETGVILYNFYIEGECYSSPVIHENKIFIGSRDNNLYCIVVE